MRHRKISLMHIAASAVLLAAGLSSGLASAAGYPEKPIKLIVPVTAGGTTDLLARSLGAKLSTVLGQPVVVENRPGANGNIGMEATATAEPDGYTLLFGTSNIATNASLYPKLPFDPLKDFAPISLFGSVTNVLVVNPALPVHSIQELVAYAKANPTALTHGSNGNGSTSHLSAEVLKSRTGIQMSHVPYKGGAPAMTDLLGGHISMIFDQIPVVMPYIKSGRVRALGVTAGKRSGAAPEIPTIAEQGLPGYDVSVWFGVIAPARTPKAVVTKLNGAVVGILEDPAFRKSMLELGVDTSPSSPDQFSQMIKDETVRWAKIIKDSGAKLD